MKQKVVVLGAGMVGHVIAMDLSTQYQVVVADKNPLSLQKFKNNNSIITQETDVQDNAQLQKIIQDADLVITALPGFMAYDVLKNVIQSGKSVADISFYPEDALQLNSLAQQQNVTVIVDCGVAPGMSNFLLGYHASQMEVKEFVCYVGGLPVERTFPFEYKAPFSPVDVIEEYTRPARLVENGKIVIKPALSEIEWIDFEGIGTLEAFNSDGLRSLLHTMQVPFMKEKTLRYPGYARLIQALQAAGFFSDKSIEIEKNISVKPITLTTEILKKAWKLHSNDKEFTVMRIIIKGIEKGRPVTYTYSLCDYFDPSTGFTSMARTTGFTCTAMVNLILKKIFDKKGVFPPELLAGQKNVFDFVMNYLKERKVNYLLDVTYHD